MDRDKCINLVAELLDYNLITRNQAVLIVNKRDKQYNKWKEEIKR